jgi:DNA-binding CsgD family transcriptional regulator
VAAVARQTGSSHHLIADAAEEAFASELDAYLAAGRPQLATVPALPAGALSAAVIDRRGRLVWQDERFASLIDPDQNDLTQARAALAGRSVAVHHGRDGDGTAICLVLAEPAATAGWPVAVDRGALERAGPGALVAVAVALAGETDALVLAGRAFGLTPLEARVSAALVRDGNLPVAARRCGVSYETAREVIESARRKAGVARQPQLVARLTALAAHTGEDGREADRVLVDAFGLTPREAALALAVMRTGSRQEAARQLGLSEALAKKQLSRVHEILGVHTASDLSRTVLDVMAGALLAGAAERDLPEGLAAREPLRLLVRPAGGLIALSDHGPASGRPLLVPHSGSAGRLVPRSLVEALQARGWRPLSLDRPGFGLTDLRPDQADPWLAARDDMVDVLDALGLRRVDFLVRGGVYGVVALARSHPHRVGRVVAMNPDVSTRHSHKRSGALGLLWTTGEADPDGNAAVTRWLASHTTPARLVQLQKVLLRRSPLDLQALAQPREQEDFRRSVGLFAAGRVEGTVREHVLHSRGVEVAPLGEAAGWQVLLGAQDPLHNPDDSLAFWRPRLPRAAFRVIDPGGRFLHLTHTDQVLEALDRR